MLDIATCGGVRRAASLITNVLTAVSAAAASPDRGARPLKSWRRNLSLLETAGMLGTSIPSERALANRRRSAGRQALAPRDGRAEPDPLSATWRHDAAHQAS